MKRRQFGAELQTGHKGAAVLVPFDPAKAWGTRPVRVASKAYGLRPGHLVRASLNGHAFDGWIGHRWGRFFILVDQDLRDAAGLEVGDTVEVVVKPRAANGPPAAPASRKARSRRKAAPPTRRPRRHQASGRARAASGL